MIPKFLTLAMAATVTGLLTACGDELPAAQKYPAPWFDDFDPGITQTLAKHKIVGCVQYARRKYYKNRGPNDPKGEYLVYCSSDGENWTALIVWPGSGLIAGPGAIYPDIPPPQVSP